MASFALSEYSFKGNTLLALYLSLGHHDPHPPGHGGHPAPDGLAQPGQYI